MRLLGALPLVGVLMTVLDDEQADAKRHRKTRGRLNDRQRGHLHDQGKQKKKHKGKGKKKRKNGRTGCQPEAAAQTCAGKCARVSNNCSTLVDCGPCSCATGCPECQTCNPATGQCIGNPAADESTCGSGGRCLAGECVCDATSCPTGCCDEGQCYPGTADTACGRGGDICLSCPAGATTCCDQVCTNTDTDEANCGVCGNVCNPARTCDAGGCVCAGTCPKNFVQQPNCTCVCPAGFEEVNGGCFRICTNGVICARFGDCTCIGSMAGSGNFLCTDNSAIGPACPDSTCPTGMACNGRVFCWAPC
jgi:hypothetical protein